MEFLNKQIEEYTLQHTTPESDVIKELVRESDQELEFIDMLSGPQIGRLLQLLILSSGAERGLEIGTFTGYASIMMADVLPENGVLITLEMNERYKAISDRFFSRSPYDRKIKQIMGDARETMSELKGDFDFIFLDADKIHYPEYYEIALPLLKTGGIMVIDNTLWGGAVLDENDPKGKKIDELNHMIQQDERVLNLMLPLRDGVMIVYKNGLQAA